MRNENENEKRARAGEKYQDNMINMVMGSAKRMRKVEPRMIQDEDKDGEAGKKDDKDREWFKEG